MKARRVEPTTMQHTLQVMSEARWPVEASRAELNRVGLTHNNGPAAFEHGYREGVKAAMLVMQQSFGAADMEADANG